MLIVGGATFTIASVFVGEAAQHFAAVEVATQTLAGHGDASGFDDRLFQHGLDRPSPPQSLRVVAKALTGA